MPKIFVVQLEKTKETIATQLKKKKLAQETRAVLTVLQYVIIFLENDQKKLREIYPYVMQMKNNDNRWEPRVWGIFQSVILLVVGWVLGGL